MPHVFDDVESEVAEVMSELKRVREQRRVAEADRESRLRGVLGGGTPAPGATGQLAALDQGILQPFETATPSAQRSQARGGIAPSVRRVAFDEAAQAGTRPATGRRRVQEDELRRQLTEAAATRIRDQGTLPPPKRSEDQLAENEAAKKHRRGQAKSRASVRRAEIDEERALQGRPPLRKPDESREDYRKRIPGTLEASRESAQTEISPLHPKGEKRDDEDRKNESRRRRGLPPVRRKGESRDEYHQRISGSEEPPQRRQGERTGDYLNRLDRMGREVRATADAQQRRKDAERAKAEAEAAPDTKANLAAIDQIEDQLTSGLGGVLRAAAGRIKTKDFVGIITRNLRKEGLTDEQRHTAAIYDLDMTIFRDKRDELVKRRTVIENARDPREGDAAEIAEINQQIDAVDEKMRTRTDQHFGIVPVTPETILDTFTGGDEDPERGPATAARSSEGVPSANRGLAHELPIEALPGRSPQPTSASRRSAQSSGTSRQATETQRVRSETSPSIVPPPGLTVGEEKQREREFETLSPANSGAVLTDAIAQQILDHVDRFYPQARTVEEKHQLARQIAREMGWIL